LKIATAVIDLSPIEDLPMGGYDGTDRLTRRTHGRLESNIALFGSPPNAIAIVSLDTLFAGPDLTATILKMFETIHRLPPERVLILASHTHFAPMLDRTKPRLGQFAENELSRWEARIFDAVQNLSQKTVVQVTAGSGESDKSVNRRLRWRMPTVVRLLGKIDGDIYACDNPLGQRDPMIRIFIFENAGGEVSAIFWSFACHPVGFPEVNTASADFVGVVREQLRKKYGASVPVLFAPGCMGDVRPRSPQPWKKLRNLPQCAIFGPTSPGFDRSQWDRWANELAGEVQAIADKGIQRHLEVEDFAAVSAALPLASIFDGDTPVSELTGKAVKIPGIGQIKTLSCEPVTAISKLFRDSDDDLIIGYEGNVFGYLPVDSIIAEGGYEANGFMKAFNLRGRWKAAVDRCLKDFSERLRI